MENVERLVITLNPELNPSGRKRPITIKREILEDPEFQELSKDEKEAVLCKIDDLIENCCEYGTLSEMAMDITEKECGLMTIVCASTMFFNKDSYNLLIPISECNKNMRKRSVVFEYVDGAVVEGGEVIAVVSVGSREYYQGKPWKKELWQIRMPFDGRVFAVADFNNEVTPNSYSWGQDLFVIGSKDDTRKDAIAWYKKVTGKVSEYKTSEEIEEEKNEINIKVDKFTSKWGI